MKDIGAAKIPGFPICHFEVVKGEVFRIRLKGFRAQRILKHKILLAPLQEDQYWVGSNYEHQPSNDLPSERGRTFIEEKLRQTLKVPYEELHHLAAIRPATKDRRPLLGRHPKFPQLAIFNGLGAKGSSLGPYFARQLARHFLYEEPIHPEADIARSPLKP